MKPLKSITLRQPEARRLWSAGDEGSTGIGGGR